MSTIGAEEVNKITANVVGSFHKPRFHREIEIGEFVTKMLPVLARVPLEDRPAAEAVIMTSLTQQEKQNREIKRFEKAEKARQSQEAENSTPSTPSTPVKVRKGESSIPSTLYTHVNVKKTKKAKDKSEKSKDKKRERSKKDKKRERSPSTPKNKHIVTEEPGAPKKSRGRTRGPNHCGKCKEEGHTARSKKCLLYEAKQKVTENVKEVEGSSSSSSDSSDSDDGEKRVSPTVPVHGELMEMSDSDSDTVPSDSE